LDLDYEVIRFVPVPLEREDFRLKQNFRLFNIHLVVHKDSQMYIWLDEDE
jgi:hypothetical protein